MDMTGFPERRSDARRRRHHRLPRAGCTPCRAFCCALHDRQTSGLGQHVDIALFEAMLSVMRLPLSVLLATGRTPTRVGNDHLNIAPYEPLRAKDGLIIVAVANPGLWVRFCEAIERPGSARRSALHDQHAPRGEPRRAEGGDRGGLSAARPSRSSPNGSRQRTCRAAACGRSARRSRIRRSPRATSCSRRHHPAAWHDREPSRRSSGCRARLPTSGSRRRRWASTPRKCWRRSTRGYDDGVFQPESAEGPRRADHRRRHRHLPRHRARVRGARLRRRRSPAASSNTSSRRVDELRALGVRAVAKVGRRPRSGGRQRRGRRRRRRAGPARHRHQRRGRQLHLPRREPVAERVRHGRRHRSEGHLQRVARARFRISRRRADR